jgi:hypothetical protein
MNRTTTFASTFAICAALAGCIAPTPSAGGQSVRAIMASQAVPPQPRPDTGSDAAAAVAAVQNYQRSYVTPVPQTDNLSFGSK